MATSNLARALELDAVANLLRKFNFSAVTDDKYIWIFGGRYLITIYDTIRENYLEISIIDIESNLRISGLRLLELNCKTKSQKNNSLEDFVVSEQPIFASCEEEKLNDLQTQICVIATWLPEVFSTGFSLSANSSPLQTEIQSLAEEIDDFYVVKMCQKLGLPRAPQSWRRFTPKWHNL